MTPIQELIEWMHLHYKSGKEGCSPTLIMFKLNEIKAKEKEFSKECFEAGRAYQTGEIKYSFTKINHDEPSFEEFYRNKEIKQ